MKATEKAKLLELRAKTDRELAALIDQRLRWAVSRLLSGADSQTCAGAECVYAETGALLPLVYHLTAEERSYLNALRDQLQALLQAAGSPDERAFAAC